MDAHWEELDRCPSSHTSNIVQIDNNRYIVAPYNYTSQRSDGILVFDIRENEWSTFAKYPTEHFDASFHSIAYDAHSNKIFMCGESLPITTLNIHQMEYFCKTSTRFETGRTPAMLMIDGKCHIIFGSDNKHHLLWNDTIQKYESLHIFDQFDKGLYNMGWIYISSTKQILLFGGFDYGDQTRYDVVMRYSVDDKQWSTLDVALPNDGGMDSFGCILTLDQRYVILCGGFVFQDWVNTIYVMDMKTMKFYESKIKCPQNGEYHGVLIGGHKDELIVTGFLRIWQLNNNFDIPIDLIDWLIRFYVRKGYLYLLKRGNGAHFRIDVNFIVDSV